MYEASIAQDLNIKKIIVNLRRWSTFNLIVVYTEASVLVIWRTSFNSVHINSNDKWKYGTEL